MGRTKKQSNKAIRRIICKTGLEQISTNTVIRNAGLKKEVSRLKKENEDKTETINGLNDENFELKNQKTRWKNFTRNCDSRNMTVDAASSLKDLKKIGFKSESLMPIEYSNIIMPLLHIFMGLAVDVQKRFRGLLSPEETETMIRFLQSIGIRMRNYWEAFSGNAVIKLMKNMDEFLAVLPNQNAELNNMKDIFKKLSVVYKFVFVAEINDQVMLEQELKNLADAYKNGEFSREFTITPKAHTLICHASQQLQRHGTIMLFSEQE
uniref:Uncharacterized protein n=1 Tax=Rhabditophanes sp. KR3021 TaxID=114890 RepID=A0AC35TT74_9BILA